MILGKLGRTATLLAVFFAGIVVAGTMTWKLGMWPSADAADAPACGTILVSGSDWLGGSGVNVYSNGADQTTGDGCANGNAEIYNLSANPPVYGFAWQCVELVNRLYATKGWYPRLWLGSDTNGGAKYLYTYAEGGKYDGLVAHANGSGYTPTPGDMIVQSEGSFGHVAIVDRVEGDTLYAVEENNSTNGWATYTYDGSTGAISRPGATISGYVHASKNTSGSVSATPITPPAVTSVPQPTVAPLPTAGSDSVPSLTITGSCTTAGGTLGSETSGFTPGGQFTVGAWYPSGAAYKDLVGRGQVRSDGSASWTWACAGDPAGTYHTSMIDVTTGRTTGVIYFAIGSTAVQNPPIQNLPTPAPTQNPPAPTKAPPAPTQAPPAPTQAPPAPSHPVFTVMNTSETAPDGVWFRNSPHTSDTDRITGLGVYMNERVRLLCYAFGDAVGSHNDRLWYRVDNVSRPSNNGQANTGYLNAHYINDGQNANVVDSGVSAC